MKIDVAKQRILLLKDKISAGDAAGILVPGGSIAVKAAQKYINSKK